MANIGISGKDLTTGKFRPVLNTDVACDASGVPIDYPKVFLGARSTTGQPSGSGAAAIDWNQIDVNVGGFTFPAVSNGTIIGFPSAGKYLIIVGITGTASQGGTTARIVINSVIHVHQFNNTGGGGATENAVNLSYIANITSIATETLQIVAINALAGVEQNFLQIIKLSN